MTRAWLRIAVTLSIGAFGPPTFAAPQRAAAKSAQEWLDEGIAAYRAVDLKAAERALLEAEQALDRDASDPEARRFAAQVWLNLGRVAAVDGRPDHARERFREALHLDPVLVVTGETDPPKIVNLLEEVRAAEEALTTDAESRPAATAEAAAEALGEARAELASGVSAYEALDLVGAVEHFRNAARLVHSVSPATDESALLKGRVHQYLGRSAAVAGRLEVARAEFRKALAADPKLSTDPKSDPPKIVELFEAVRAEPTPAPPSIGPGGSWGRNLLLGLVGAALMLLLLRRRGARAAPMIAGTWSLSTTLLSNNVGSPNGATNTEDVVVRQRGREVSIEDNAGRELFRAVVEGKSIHFAGDSAQGPGEGGRARSYSGDGTVSSSLIEGSLSMTVAHDVQTNGFQFQSMSKYDYNLTMTRIWGQSSSDAAL